MNFTNLSVAQSSGSRHLPVARMGRVLLISTLAAAVIACAPARKAAYPTSPLFVSVATDQSPSVVIKRDIDLVRLEGVLGSQQQIDLVTSHASDLFGAEMIINSLELDESLADAEWLQSVLQTVDAVQDVEDFSLLAGSGQLVVGGSVTSSDEAEQISNTASDLAGLNLAVSSTIAYPQETIADNTVAEPSLVPEEGIAVSLVSLAVLEQQAQAVALEQPAVLPVAAVAVAPDQPSVQQLVQPSMQQRVDLPVDQPMDQPVALPQSQPLPELPELLPKLVVQQAPEVSPEPTGVPVVIEPAKTATDTTAVVEPVVPDDFVVIPASVNKQVMDSDGDGVADANDECTSRSGYPVNTRGCQLLDGYLKDVHFYGASDQLTEDAMLSLNNIADIMTSHPDSKIAVLSYSQDGSPTEMRMQARERAYSVVDYLVSQGIDPARLQAFALSHRQGISEQILIKEVD